MSGVKVIYGTAAFGLENTSTGGISVVFDEQKIKEILDIYKKHGGDQLDTARTYADGTSEKALANIAYDELGFKLDTKIPGFQPGDLSAEKVHKNTDDTVAALKNKKIHIFYLHAPDRSVPFEETLKAVNEEYKKGRFEKFGISNFSADEVEKVVQISKDNGYILPSVYQGMYNLLARKGEKALFPVLRKHNIAFYGYSPIAGSFLTDNDPRKLERFDTTKFIGTLYGNYYLKESMFQALDTLKAAAKKHNIGVTEIALRWLANHSALKGENGDAIIIGGTNKDRVDQTLQQFKSGPLPKDVLDTIEQVWTSVESDAPPAQF